MSWKPEKQLRNEACAALTDWLVRLDEESKTTPSLPPYPPYSRLDEERATRVAERAYHRAHALVDGLEHEYRSRQEREATIKVLADIRAALSQRSGTEKTEEEK